MATKQLYQVQEFDEFPEQQIDFLQDLGLGSKEIDLLFSRGTWDIEDYLGTYRGISTNGEIHWWHLPKATYDLWRKLNG